MKSSRCVVPAVILFLCCIAHALYAAPPRIISYQGYLNDGAGKPVTTATNLTFSLYSTASGVGPVWTENRSVNPANGVYSIGLGEVTPLMVSFSRQYYLGTQVGTDPELRPLQMLMAVPYALHAGCFPGDMLNCYTGSPETLNVGLCKGGVRTCTSDGSGFGTCVGEFTPNCNGVCLDFSSNVANCGACGTACSFANAIPACQNSNCVISSCTAGWGNCDGNSTNGCEINTSTSVTNCGSCRTVCNKTNGTPFCTGGMCNIACNTGWANCDGTLANGCEINLNSTANCGYCGNDCSSTNGAPYAPTACAASSATTTMPTATGMLPTAAKSISCRMSTTVERAQQHAPHGRMPLRSAAVEPAVLHVPVATATVTTTGPTAARPTCHRPSTAVDAGICALGL